MSAKASDIEAALTAAFLAAFPDAETLCAWPNRKFDTKGKAKWYQFHYLPGPSQPVSMGTGGQDGVTGVVQVNLFIEPDQGDKAARDFGDALRSAFTAGRGLPFNEGVVTIRNAGQSGNGYKVDQHYRTVFIISWESRLHR